MATLIVYKITRMTNDTIRDSLRLQKCFHFIFTFSLLFSRECSKKFEFRGGSLLRLECRCWVTDSIPLGKVPYPVDFPL